MPSVAAAQLDARREEYDLLSALHTYVLGSGNPDMISYGRSFIESANHRIRGIRHLMDLGRMYNARVLDIGCGFGWNAIIIALLGNNGVVANDIRPTMTEVIEQRLLALRQQGVFPRVSTMLADVCTLDLPAESFDAVLCHQAIEHVRDLERMFRVVSQALRHGGRGVFTNDSNVYHPPTKRWTEQMWELRDNSTEYTEKLKQERPIENEDIEPYAVMRRGIVAGCRPDLQGTELEAITTATAGMDRAEIEAFCSRYKPGDTLPTPPALSRCRNPVTGEYCERLLDPFEVAEMARRAGLRARVHPHRFNRFPLTVLNVLDGVPFRWLNRAFFRFKPQFVVVVEKS